MIELTIYLDDEDADLANTIASVLARDNKKSASLARLIADRIGLPSTHRGTNMVIDHINGNPLDNRRCNLQLITIAENQAKSKKHNNTRSSIYRGVDWRKKPRKWRAKATQTINGEKTYFHLGYFDSEEEAARSYDRKANELWGKYAILNFPE